MSNKFILKEFIYLILVTITIETMMTSKIFYYIRLKVMNF